MEASHLNSVLEPDANGASPIRNDDVLIDVVIPALNEQESIPLVLDDLPPVRFVYVANNGSTDATATVATEKGAIVVDEPRQGYGSACLRGLAAIRSETQSGTQPPDVVVFLDADYSDHPQFLTALVDPIAAGDADMVLGSRLLGLSEPGAMPIQSVMGNRFACLLMRVLFGARYTDLGPFRAIRYSSLVDLQMCDENFGWTIEMQIKATRSGLRVREIPVPYRKRIGTSKISGTISGSIKAGWKILYTIAKYGLRRNPKKRALMNSSNDDQPAGKADQRVRLSRE